MRTNWGRKMSTGSGRTKVVAGPFDNRENAQSVERNIQNHLDDNDHQLIDGIDMPDWAKGVRVEKIENEAGQGDNWAVIATEDAR